MIFIPKIFYFFKIELNIIQVFNSEIFSMDVKTQEAICALFISPNEASVIKVLKKYKKISETVPQKRGCKIARILIKMNDNDGFLTLDDFQSFKANGILGEGMTWKGLIKFLKIRKTVQPWLSTYQTMYNAPIIKENNETTIELTPIWKHICRHAFNEVGNLLEI